MIDELRHTRRRRIEDDRGVDVEVPVDHTVPGGHRPRPFDVRVLLTKLVGELMHGLTQLREPPEHPLEDIVGLPKLAGETPFTARTMASPASRM